MERDAGNIDSPRKLGRIARLQHQRLQDQHAAAACLNNSVCVCVVLSLNRLCMMVLYEEGPSKRFSQLYKCLKIPLFVDFTPPNFRWHLRLNTFVYIVFVSEAPLEQVPRHLRVCEGHALSLLHEGSIFCGTITIEMPNMQTQNLTKWWIGFCRRHCSAPSRPLFGACPLCGSVFMGYWFESCRHDKRWCCGSSCESSERRQIA